MLHRPRTLTLTFRQMSNEMCVIFFRVMVWHGVKLWTSMTIYHILYQIKQKHQIIIDKIIDNVTREMISTHRIFLRQTQIELLFKYCHFGDIFLNFVYKHSVRSSPLCSGYCLRLINRTFNNTIRKIDHIFRTIPFNSVIDENLIFFHCFFEVHRFLGEYICPKNEQSTAINNKHESSTEIKSEYDWKRFGLFWHSTNTEVISAPN